MDAATRHEKYNAMDRKVTPAQQRRMRHKFRSRKTHAHPPGEVPEGRRTPGPVNCPRCRPGAKRWDRSLAGKAT